jgi:transcriptional regulator with XRE-family HTH domain
MPLRGEQIRAARDLLRWDQKKLASAANVSVETIKRLESMRGPVAAQYATVEAITKALEAESIEFTEDAGHFGVRRGLGTIRGPA